jgi:hypothetical protein
MSNDLMLKTYFIMAFKIGLKSDLRMKLEEASHLTKEQKHLKIVLPGEVHPVRNSRGALNHAKIIIKPESTALQRSIISNGVNIILYYSLCSAHCLPVRQVGVLDFKMKLEVTALVRDS